jgi:hypothetical protein
MAMIAIMTYHMHGLVLGQFLWFEQYRAIQILQRKFDKIIFPEQGKYLEIGGGHGLYMLGALVIIANRYCF